MIRVVLIDFGNTLVRESDLTPFAHVAPALETIGMFTDDTGSPLSQCLASNYPAQLPVPPAQVPAVFDQFLELLQSAGLTKFFRPVERHVTISGQAGFAKPRPEFFTKALQRLGVSAGFDECLFITENEEHIARCRELGMKALQFGGHRSPPPPGTEFTDWSEAPLLIARLASPDNQANLEAAVRGHLRAVHHLKVSSIQQQTPADLRVQAQAWVPLSDPALGELQGVHVELPVSARVRLDDRGRVAAVEGARPSTEDVAEATEHVQSLVSTGQVETRAEQSPLGTTHDVEVDPQGRRYLKRRRFTAF
jgi:hypothetical protein